MRDVRDTHTHGGEQRLLIDILKVLNVTGCTLSGSMFSFFENLFAKKLR